MKFRYFSLLLFVLFNLAGCTPNSANLDDTKTKFVPDHTPYIAGLIEATDDTVHHFPEVVVGSMSDPLNPHHPNILTSYPGLCNTSLWAQVVKTAQYFKLIFKPEKNAKVQVKGPLDSKKEQTVVYHHLRNGVYGDSNYELDLLPNQKYRLTVILPDGERYQSTTIIPESTVVSVPDSIGIEVKYEPYGDGTPYETHVKRIPIIFRYPEQTYVFEIQQNSNNDRELLLMEPGEEFRFKDRGPYLRAGGAYGIELANMRVDTITNSWGQRLDKPKENIWMKRRQWYRFSFFSKGVGGNFFAIFDIYTSDQHYLKTMNDRLFNAIDTRDSTYLFDISTIRKVNEQGQVLPKDSSDAIGFFGGYFSVYRRATLYPIRTFDLDSVLSATSE